MNFGPGPAVPVAFWPPAGCGFGTVVPPGFGPGFGAGFAPPFGFGTGFGTLPMGGLAFGLAPMSDGEMKYFVEQSLDNDPAIPASTNIGVGVQNGVVTLTGTVSNKRIKHDAGDDAWWIPQVIDVHNEIQVQSRKNRAAGTGTAGQGAGRRAAAR